nr:uncharacterized protein LOC112789639 isoform X3 [Arachis hypogaea]
MIPTTGRGFVTSGSTAGVPDSASATRDPAAVAGKVCRWRDLKLSSLSLEVAAALPPNRFGDRRCFGSAAPSSVRVVETVAKVAWS